jgi:hypothetical protein
LVAGAIRRADCRFANTSEICHTDAMKKRRLMFFSLLFLAVALPVRAETLIAVTSDRKLHFFDSLNPTAFWKTLDITGLSFSDVMLSAACTPTGELFVLTHASSTMSLHVVDPQTGAVIQNVPTTAEYPIAATHIGMDIDPASPSQADIVHDVDQILSLGTSGSIAAIPIAYDSTTTDGDPIDAHAGGNPSVVGLAHTNNFRNAESSVLYAIDAARDALVTIERANGRLNTIGPLGVDTNTTVGFDISGVTGNAYAALTTDSGTFLHKVNLTTGRATSIGRIGPVSGQTGVVIRAITTLPPTRVANLSTRAQIVGNANAMIAGFVASGGGDTQRLLIRGLGPSLANAGVLFGVPDPVLQIVDSNGVVIATNDDWKLSTQQGAISATGLAPTNDREAAYVGSFAAGAYTAILSGKNNGIGTALVEIYQLNN